MLIKKSPGRSFNKCTISGNGHIYSPNGINKQKTLDLRNHDQKRALSNSRKRNKYKMLNPEIKRQAVNLVRDCKI